MSKYSVEFKSANPAIWSSSNIEFYIGTVLRNQYLFERRTTPHEVNQWNKCELDSFTIRYKQIDRLYYISVNSFNRKGKDCELIVRMKYKDGTDIYVHLTAGYYCISNICDAFECLYYGTIFISKDVKCFMKLILIPFYDLDDEYELELDSIFIKIYNDNDEYNKIKRTVLTSKYLCREVIYNNYRNNHCRFIRLMPIPFYDLDDVYELLKFDGIYIKPYIDNNKYKTKKTVLTLEYLCYEVIYKNKKKLQSYFKYIPRIILKDINEFIIFKNAQNEYENIV